MNSPITLAGVPSYENEPQSWEPSNVVATIRRANPTRRTVLRFLAMSSMTIGLAYVDLFPRVRKANAVNPSPTYSEWGTCAPNGPYGVNYFDSSTICTPSNSVFSGNCSGSWHRNDSYSSPTNGTAYNYTFDNTSCGNKNAWRWTGSVARRKCSDGRVWYRDAYGALIYNNRFSICRTAI